MRGVRAVISCLLAALALSGCMRSSAPVAVAQPRGDLDSMAYGQTYNMAARYVVPLGTALSPGDTVLVGERWF
jgi:polysaccharide export outer membrane protein